MITQMSRVISTMRYCTIHSGWRATIGSAAGIGSVATSSEA